MAQSGLYVGDFVFIGIGAKAEEGDIVLLYSPGESRSHRLRLNLPPYAVANATDTKPPRPDLIDGVHTSIAGKLLACLRIPDKPD